MASTWTTGWESELDNDTVASRIDDEINDTRGTIAAYANREHLVDAANDDEEDLWKHAPGSARTYVQATEPDTTGYGAAEEGKIWVKTEDPGVTDEPDLIAGIYVWVWDDADEVGDWQDAPGNTGTYVQSSAPDTTDWTSLNQGRLWIKTEDHGQTGEPDNIVEIYYWVWDESDDSGAWKPYADPTMTGAICYFAADPPNVSEITPAFPWLPLDGTAGASGDGTITTSDYDGLYYRLVKHLNPGGSTTSATLPNIDGEYIRVVKPGDGTAPDPSQSSESDAYTHYGSQIPTHDHTIGTTQFAHEHSFTTSGASKDLDHTHDVKGTSSTTGQGELSLRSDAASLSEKETTGVNSLTDLQHTHSGTTDAMAAGDWSNAQGVTNTLGSSPDHESVAKDASPTSIYNSNDEVVPPSIVMRAYIHA